VAAVVLVLQGSCVAQAAALATFSSAGAEATATLLNVYYAGRGLWRVCNQPTCSRTNGDWGADSATFALYLRWKTTHDPAIAAVASELLAAAPRYPAPCDASPCPWWSDTPSWDAVALMRESEILGGNRAAVARARAAFRYVTRSGAFISGACPTIPFQRPQPADPTKRRVKTLETDANIIKAALLLYGATHERAYLDVALRRYAASRRYFLDPAVPLYTVHVIDDGTCVQSPHRFFASVNGDMIWNGLQLWRATGRPEFYAEALATARAVDSLSDERGVFVDLQGENDVVEPLVEAMYDLAATEHLAFARAWILRNAEAALSARAPDGTFPRFFDGPPQAKNSIWESNGGLALEIAAAALDPDGVPVPDGWGAARVQAATLTEVPATITFDGSGIALIGKIGASCMKAHLRVYVDGVETFDHTGLWQNYDMPSGSLRFAWRWPTAGEHTLRIEPSDPDADNAVHLESLILTAEK
jgi:hypothetical protein